MFLILKPENKEVCAKILKCLDEKDWTFGRGKPIKGHKDTMLDFCVILYKDKTIRLGTEESLHYYSNKVPVITVNDIPFEFDDWLEEIKKSVEEAIKKEVEYGIKTSL